MSQSGGTVSLCVISRDGARRLPHLLAVTQGHVDEVVVGVDSRTTDGTREIARSFGALVYDFEWVDRFDVARNSAIERATSEWVLVLDDDELPDCEFLRALPGLVGKTAPPLNPPPGGESQASPPTGGTEGGQAVAGYKMLGRHFMDGVFVEDWYPSWHIRLFRQTCRYEGRVHEAPVGVHPMLVCPGHVLHFMWSGARQEKKNALYRRLQAEQIQEGRA